MEFVEPIRDRAKIDAIKTWLKGNERTGRDFLLFTLGINCGLRISDLLKLKVTDVKNKARIAIRESKTNKMKDFPISDNAKKAIKDYLKNTGLNEAHYLFPSRKGQKPISRIQAYRILNDAAKACGINDKIGTHSLRKSFCYHAFIAGTDINILVDLMNHSNPAQTKRYMGINRDMRDQVYLNLNL